MYHDITSKRIFKHFIPFSNLTVALKSGTYASQAHSVAIRARKVLPQSNFITANVLP